MLNVWLCRAYWIGEKSESQMARNKRKRPIAMVHLALAGRLVCADSYRVIPGYGVTFYLIWKRRSNDFFLEIHVLKALLGVSNRV